MKSLSQHVNESFNSFEQSKFMTMSYVDSSETGNIWDSMIGYIDNETTLTYCTPIDSGLEPFFRLATGKKFHDTDKRNWSKKYSVNLLPAKFANHGEELISAMNNQLLSKSLDSDQEFQDFLGESLLGAYVANGQDLITRIVNACKKSSQFVKKLLLMINNPSKNINESTELNEEFIFERSWFSAIVTNALLLIAFSQVSKINNKWLRTLLLALIAERVITTNDLGRKLKNLIS